MNRMLYTYGAIVSLGAVGYAGCELIDWRSLTATEWAAWVGAMGTIAAIVGSFALARRQKLQLIERQREQDCKEYAQFLNVMVSLVASCKTSGQTFKQFWEARDHVRVERVCIPVSTTLKGTLEKIPLFQIRDTRLATDVIFLPQSLHQLHAAIELAYENNLQYGEDHILVESVNSFLTMVIDHFSETYIHLEKLVEEYDPEGKWLK